MMNTFDPLRALNLAGTISIPNPYPEMGWISMGRLASPAEAHGCATDMLRIEHPQSNRLMIARTVRISDVEAVYFADHSENPRKLRRTWFAAGSGRLAEIPKWLYRSRTPRTALLGTVFVRESAQVLMEVQVGLTAAESAEYYPPVVRDRNDSHYQIIRDCSQLAGEGAQGLGACNEILSEYC